MSDSETDADSIIELNDDVFLEIRGQTAFSNKKHVEAILESILESLADAPPEKNYALDIELQEKTVLTKEKLQNTSYQDLRRLTSLDEQHPTKDELIDAVLEEYESISPPTTANE